MLLFFLIVWYEFMYINTNRLGEIVFSYGLLHVFQDVLDYYEFNDDNELVNTKIIKFKYSGLQIKTLRICLLSFYIISQ